MTKTQLDAISLRKLTQNKEAFLEFAIAEGKRFAHGQPQSWYKAQAEDMYARLTNISE